MASECIIKDQRWTAIAIQPLAARAVDATLAHLGLEPTRWDVSILASDDTQIQTLNARFRTKDAPTNVLSFPSAERAPAAPGEAPASPEGDPELGDLALSFDTCQQEAAAQNIPLEHHATHLIVHGVLHLLGYDHEDDLDGDLMESLETAILSTLGVSDPYN